MEITGPFGDIKYLQKLPPPCAYDPNPRRDLRAPFFNSRLADHYLEKVAKVKTEKFSFQDQEHTTMKPSGHLLTISRQGIEILQMEDFRNWSDPNL